MVVAVVEKKRETGVGVGERERERERQTDRQTDRQTETDRQTDRQTDRSVRSVCKRMYGRGFMIDCTI